MTRRLLAAAMVPVWPVLDGYSLRVNELLQSLATDWDIVLIAPQGTGRAVGPGPLPTYERIELPPHLVTSIISEPAEPVRSEFRAFVGAAASSRCPDAVLLWPGTEHTVFGRREGNVVVDRIDCQFLTLWRQLARPGAIMDRLRTLRDLIVAGRYEREMARSVAATIVVGEADARALRRLSGRRSVRTIPNGVRVDSGQPAFTEAERPTVVFSGVLDYEPNIDAACYFAQEIWPSVLAAVPDAEFLIVGRSPDSRVSALASLPGVSVRGDVPDMKAILSSAWVCVAPMLSGSGIKNKVLEAWAAGKPVVLTRMAANGLRLDSTIAGCVARDGKELSIMTQRLLESSEARRQAGEAALRLVRAQHSWESAADELSAVLSGVCRGSGAGKSACTRA